MIVVPMANTLSELLESSPGVDGVGQVLNTSLQRGLATAVRFQQH